MEVDQRQPEQHPFKVSLRSIQEEINKIRINPPRPKEYTLRISDIEQKFKSYYEDITPKPVLSDVYTCIGRMKFYGDGLMFIYLEIADNERKQLAWPVRATWKVELIDENDYSNNNSTFLLGEATCIFNKPKQGFVSHPTDWISVSLERIKNSGLIARDNAVTMRWSAVAEPVLQDVYLEKFSELLNNAENYYDLFHGNAIQKIKADMCSVNENSEEHKSRISKLETILPSISDKLGKIEEKQDSMDGQFKSILSRLDNIKVNNHIPNQIQQSVA